MKPTPVVAAAINQYGVWMFVPLKLLMLAIWRVPFTVLPDRWELLFLIGGTTYFAVVVLLNAGILATTMGV